MACLCSQRGLSEPSSSSSSLSRGLKLWAGPCTYGTIDLRPGNQGDVTSCTRSTKQLPLGSDSWISCSCDTIIRVFAVLSTWMQVYVYILKHRFNEVVFGIHLLDQPGPSRGSRLTLQIADRREDEPCTTAAFRCRTTLLSDD